MIVGMKALSLVTYTGWKFLVLKDRWDRSEDFQSSQPIFSLEVTYTLLMICLLVSASNAFLAIAMLTIGMHVTFGCYVEIFRPEIVLSDSNQQLMSNYWTYILFDSLVTLMSFALMIGVTNG